jgi:hypothetical protein
MTRQKLLAVLFAAAFGTSTLACVGMFPKPLKDPTTAQVFPPSLNAMDTRIKMSITSVEGADSEFKGSLKGTTPKMQQSPDYASMLGKYEATMKRLEGAKAKWKEISTWAETVKADPDKDDLGKLNSEGSALAVELANIDSSLRQLPGDMTRVQMMNR